MAGKWSRFEADPLACSAGRIEQFLHRLHCDVAFKSGRIAETRAFPRVRVATRLPVYPA
jgi:hypothetical protein